MTTAMIYVIVSGPCYTALGIESSEASEALGIPLNQMARVAAYDGEMTDEDREYLNSILPLEEYKNRYYPCTTDMLKWSEGFDNDALEDGIWSHWFSMLVRNPRLYFEAWELQTFGFWAVNTEQQVGGYSWNISAGVPINTSQESVEDLRETLGVNPASMATDERLTDLFPVDSWSVPISWLFWTASYLLLATILCKKPMWGISLIPSIAIILTLFVATPTCYWPRYGALLQFCIPVYVVFVYLLFISGPRRSRRF